MPAPDIAFEYMKSEFAKAVIEKGSFRIGTLYDFRAFEEKNSQIGDSNEGKIHGRSEVLSWTSGNPMLRNEHAEQFGRGKGLTLDQGSSVTFGPNGAITFEADGSVSMKNIGLSSELSVKDMYVLSLTSECDFSVMKAFGYDSCIRINDVGGLVSEISKCLNLESLGHQAVTYQNRIAHYDLAKRLNPAWIKEPNYAHQNEIRALWLPSAPTIYPVIITISNPSRYCEIVDTNG